MDKRSQSMSGLKEGMMGVLSDQIQNSVVKNKGVVMFIGST